MSKEAAARVRDELLQNLYAQTLRCTLAFAHAGIGDKGQTAIAVAAGVAANLKPEDLLLLPQKGAAAFRVLRGLPALGQAPPGFQAAGVLPLPDGEAAAVAYALGAVAAAQHSGAGVLVCAVLPGTVSLQQPETAGQRRVTARLPFPQSWAEAGVYAAQRGLPLLLVSDRVRPQSTAGTGAHLLPAPLYPSIPVDRQDALAAYRVAFECAARARDRGDSGGGPSHLDAVPFHAGLPDENETALAQLEAALRKRGAFSKVWQRQLERQLVRELTQ